MTAAVRRTDTVGRLAGTGRVRLLVLVAVAGLVCPDASSAQRLNREPASPTGRVVTANALIGGGTAAVRAAIGRRNVTRAFVMGAAGGFVHAGGKLAVNNTGDLAPWAALVFASVGTSITSNAGQGLQPLEELYLPIGMARLRWTSRSPRTARVTVSLPETVVAAEHFLTRHLAFDARRSLQSGAFVFETRRREILSHGEPVNGVAIGSTIVISQFAGNAPLTFRHEVVHVRQFHFFDEAVGRPLEMKLRKWKPLRRWIPSWLEVGGFGMGMLILEPMLGAQAGPVRTYMEDEADRITRR